MNPSHPSTHRIQAVLPFVSTFPTCPLATPAHAHAMPTPMPGHGCSSSHNIPPCHRLPCPPFAAAPRSLLLFIPFKLCTAGAPSLPDGLLLPQPILLHADAHNRNLHDIKPSLFAGSGQWPTYNHAAHNKIVPQATVYQKLCKPEPQSGTWPAQERSSKWATRKKVTAGNGESQQSEECRLQPRECWIKAHYKVSQGAHPGPQRHCITPWTPPAACASCRPPLSSLPTSAWRSPRLLHPTPPPPTCPRPLLCPCSAAS